MSKNKKVIFIDRDGVINKDPGGWTEHNYVTRWEDFHFLPGAMEGIRRLNDSGYEIIIISNQAGVSKGIYTERKLKSVTEKMLTAIKKSGGRIRNIYYCTHQDSDACDCRKPKTGLFRRAEEEMGIKTAGSYFIGDGRVDVEAGKRAGLKTILVLSGKTALEEVKKWDVKPDHIFKDLACAVDFILKRGDEI
ncbi:MAG: hypothetical protein A2987_06515 [Omnitrophica bacterium RIFCSPLOWO2_01_FULL_45_10]|nr:MAG: hypothetical protein A2987_06515 [Omnitrophica bacterium RIFCSPLOWO2_01_FULL_45_10]